ncbi:hypothetical protein LguiB_003541 [Lonicera macranthoides]
MSILSLIFLLCCLFTHACNARHLDAFAFKHFSPKVVEKKLPSDSVQTSATKPDFELKSLSKEVKSPGKGENSGMIHEGNGIVESSSTHMGLLKTTKTEGTSWREGRGGEEDHEVNNNTTSNSTVNEEGYMETDYDPPHRKSPIHNK